MKNLVVWDSLKIEESVLEIILKFNFFDNFALEMTDLLILRQNKNKLSFIISEVAIWFLGVIFLVPLNLLLFQKWLLDSNQLQGFAIVIIVSAILSSGVLLGVNLFLWQKAKKLQSIATIYNKIAGYNKLIQNLQLLTQFNTLSTVVSNDRERSDSEITTALQITKDSLLKSLEIEKFILQNKQLQLQARYQLFSNLENDLVQFMSLSARQNETEYQQLLTEAIQIGLSVHQEVRKNITMSS